MVGDSFVKLVWIYNTKTTNTEEVIRKVETQKSVFVKASRIIANQDAVFKSEKFEENCKQYNV